MFRGVGTTLSDRYKNMEGVAKIASEHGAAEQVGRAVEHIDIPAVRKVVQASRGLEVAEAVVRGADGSTSMGIRGIASAIFRGRF